MNRTIALSLALSSSVAAADDGNQMFYSVPLDIGYAARWSIPNGSSIGLRPEAMTVERGPGLRTGFGLFGEAVITADAPVREVLFGGGLTGAVYGETYALAASIGADERFASGEAHPQLVASVFLGVRDAWGMAPFDVPLGFRFDARRGTASIPASVTVSISFDTLGIVLVGMLAHAILTHHPH